MTKSTTEVICCLHNVMVQLLVKITYSGVALQQGHDISV